MERDYDRREARGSLSRVCNDRCSPGQRIQFNCRPRFSTLQRGIVPNRDKNSGNLIGIDTRERIWERRSSFSKHRGVRMRRKLFLARILASRRLETRGKQGIRSKSKQTWRWLIPSKRVTRFPKDSNPAYSPAKAAIAFSILNPIRFRNRWKSRSNDWCETPFALLLIHRRSLSTGWHKGARCKYWSCQDSKEEILPSNQRTNERTNPSFSTATFKGGEIQREKQQSGFDS